MSRFKNALRWAVNALYNSLIWLVALVCAIAVVAMTAGLIEGAVG